MSTDEWRQIIDQIMLEVREIYPRYAPYESAHEAYAVLLEEIEEFWEAVKMGGQEIDEDGRDRDTAMNEEIIHVAAVAITTLKTLEVKYPVKKNAD